MHYLPFLREQGIECDVSSFFDDGYTRAVLASGHKRWWRFVASLANRLRAVASAGKYDLVVVHAEFVPFAPFALERWLARMATPYVVDFDDAFFHSYDAHPSWLVRRMFGRKLARLMAGAAVNVAGNEYLAEYARRVTDRVSVVPTVVDLKRFPESPRVILPRPFRIGWIGSPATTGHLQSVMGELAEFARGRDVEILAIGAKPFEAGGAPIRFVEWTEATEVEELSSAHVGIMPLPDTPFARGKCGFKLIQAMACWRPVIGSPVGANCRIVEHGVSGFLARSGEWAAMLTRLYDDPGLAEAMGIAGRQSVARSYSLDVWGPRVASLWADAARRAPKDKLDGN